MFRFFSLHRVSRVNPFLAADTPLNPAKFPVSFLSSEIEKMAPRELAYSAHTAHRLGLENSGFWRRLAYCAADNVNKSPSKYLAQIIFALAHRENELPELSKSLITLIESFGKQSATGEETSLVLKGMVEHKKIHGDLITKYPRFFSDLINHITKMDSRSLLISTISAAKISLKNDKLYETVAFRMKDQLSGLTIEELSGLLRAFATASGDSNLSEFKIAVVSKIKDEIFGLDPLVMSELIESLSRLGWLETDLIERFRVELERDVYSCPLPELITSVYWLIKASTEQEINLEQLAVRSGRLILRGIESLDPCEIGMANDSFHLLLNETNSNDFKITYDRICKVAGEILQGKLLRSHISKNVALMKTLPEISSLKISLRSALKRQMDQISEIEKVFVLKNLIDCDENALANNLVDRFKSEAGTIACSIILRKPISIHDVQLSSMLQAVVYEADSESFRDLLVEKLQAESDAIDIFDQCVLASRAALTLSKNCLHERDNSHELPIALINRITRSIDDLDGCEDVERIMSPLLRAILNFDLLPASTVSHLMTQICLYEERLSCKLLCRALQVCRKYVIKDSVVAICRGAVQTAHQLLDDDFVSLLKLLSFFEKSGLISTDEIAQIGPIMSVKFRKIECPKSKRFIKSFGQEHHIDVEELAWHRDLVQGEK